MTTKLAVLVLSKPRSGPAPFIEFDKESILIGRSCPKPGTTPPDFELVNDGSASRPHARLSLQNSAWHLEDLSSKHGTFVDGVRLSAPQPVTAGSLIQTGATFWTLCPSGHLIFRHGQALFVCEFLPVVARYLSENQIPTLFGASAKNLAFLPSKPFSFTFSVQGLSDPLVVTVPSIGPKEQQSISCSRIPWNSGRIAASTRSQQANIIISTEHARLSVFPSEVEVLGPWDWTTDARFHRSLAAFAVPEHPTISRILQTFAIWASPNGAVGAPPQLDAEPERTLFGGLYDFLASEFDIAYRLPQHERTATHHVPWQTIRPPDRIFRHMNHRVGEGTCLDLALLLGSCAERAGLFPVLVLCGDSPGHPSHAMVGVWRGASHGGKALLNHDSLRRRVFQGQVLLVETTEFSRMGGMKPLTFGEAMSRAQATLREAPWAVGIDIGYLRKTAVPVRPLAPV